MKMILDIDPKFERELLELQASTGLMESREFINAALATLQWVAECLKQGRVVGGIDTTKGSYIEADFSFLTATGRQKTVDHPGRPKLKLVHSVETIFPPK